MNTDGDDFNDDVAGDAGTDYAGGFESDDGGEITDDFDQKDEITGDKDDENLNNFWDTPEGKEDEKESEGDKGGADENAEATQMRETLLGHIDNYRLADDAIPEDFNASDPQALKGLLETTSKNSIEYALQLMFVPMQKAMDMQNKAFESRLSEVMESGIQQNNTQALLEKAIPQVNDPVVGKLIAMTFKQAQARHGQDTQAAIRATKLQLKAAGINITGKPLRGGNQAPEGGRTGLDSMAPLPAPNRQTQRTQNKLRR